MKYKKVTIYIRYDDDVDIDTWIGANIDSALNFQADDLPIIEDIVVEEKDIKTCSKFK